MPKSSGGWKASSSPAFLPEGLRAVTVEHGPTREQFVRAVQRGSHPCFVTGLLKASPALFLFIIEVVPPMKIPGAKGESTKDKSTESKSGRPETPKLGKGRREQRRELAQIDRRV